MHEKLQSTDMQNVNGSHHKHMGQLPNWRGAWSAALLPKICLGGAQNKLAGILLEKNSIFLTGWKGEGESLALPQPCTRFPSTYVTNIFLLFKCHFL